MRGSPTTPCRSIISKTPKHPMQNHIADKHRKRRKRDKECQRTTKKHQTQRTTHKPTRPMGNRCRLRMAICHASSRSEEMWSFIGLAVCISCVLSAHAATKYNYDEVLEKSILFYEAQRSGKLPANNRIPWRADSALNDRGLKGEDLTGGWYDAGDNLKFGFPKAGAVTLLNWGLLRFKDAYQDSGQLDHMYDCVRWGLTWLVKCHTAPNELYVQVGDVNQDHSHWERPENMTEARTPLKVDPAHPGSDVASEYAAAMASGYLVFKTKDPKFANSLLQHAKQLYSFATKYIGRYSQSVPDINTYGSSDESDEITWGGAWLYKATNDSTFLQQAESKYDGGPSAKYGQGWDNKGTGAMILLHELTGKDKYLRDIEDTFNGWLPGGSVPYNPQGLAIRNKWGTLRHAANQGFMALIAAEDGIHTTQYSKWAMSQVHIALGDTGRSFVVGFGNNPPSHVHHRGAYVNVYFTQALRDYIINVRIKQQSCPAMSMPCGFSYLNKKTPNPHVITGALVGGPGLTGNYDDIRSDYVKNEVALDYNAGFQSAVAGLKSLALRGLLPASS
ncbi:hypothetical protein FSP39_017518 [Pinctada imbricata]|uniref:Endoglucanase n=1 Tax=Pinctada imbricata TaxID=66713 RepID=A0AA88YDP0_PINIB|nr:hypothetical protein FSP39_017518 [Pinctada imbricata]